MMHNINHQSHLWKTQIPHSQGNRLPPLWSPGELRALLALLSFFLNFRILFILLYSRFLLVIHFIHISVYMSIPISQFITPPPLPHHFPPLVSIRLFSTSGSLFLPCKPVHLYHFNVAAGRHGNRIQAKALPPQGPPSLS